MAAGRRSFKRESTMATGLPTPHESFASHTFASLKRERVDLTAIDDPQELNTVTPPSAQPQHLRRSYHPENMEEDLSESFLADQQRRSVSVSVRTSYPPSQVPPTVTPRSPNLGGDGLQLIGRDVNRLVDLIDRLRRIGLNSVDGALPELVLCGDQSAGKSSLMGAIAEINLPKGASMCTRCPTNIKTTPATEWGCTVSLQEDHVYEPTRKQGVTYAFPNWVKREGMLSRLFKTIDDKAELEEVLKWAQIALLSPSQNHESFVPGTREQALKKQQIEFDESKPARTEVQFSPNVIAVEIRGPGLPALSFFDLPGLFRSAKDGRNQFLAKVFEDLTSKYIKHPNAIIICAITMANDPSISDVQRLIRKHKAEAKCIGVLTMPDRLQWEPSTGLTHPDYDLILRKETYVLPRGYFVTKQPGPGTKIPAGSENYHGMARQEEETFFDTHELWRPGGAWGFFRDRCGTGTIQKYLSKEFANQILRSIPDLTLSISEQMNSVERDLSHLPEISKDRVQHVVRQRLFEFSHEVKTILSGKSDSDSTNFQWEWKLLCRQFLKAIEIMRPGCKCTHPDDSKMVGKTIVITIDDSDDESVQSHGASANKRRAESISTESPTKRPRFHDGPVHINSPSTPRRYAGSLQPPGSRGLKREAGVPERTHMSATVRKLKDVEIGPFCQKYLDCGYHAMSIEDIQSEIEKRGRAGAPGLVNHKVREYFAMQAVSFWKDPLQTFIDHSFRMVRAQILSILATVLQEHKLTDLYKKSREHVEEYLIHCEREQRPASMEFYEVEKSRLFTINDEEFERHKAESLAILKEHRRRVRVQCYADKFYRPSNRNAGSEFPDAAKEDFKSKVTDAQLGSDPFNRELDEAAYVRGYYTTARLRFVDSVCINMHTKYFLRIAEGIVSMLEEKFGLDRGEGENICAALLEGSAEIAERRNFLRNRKAQLVEFSRTLDELRNDTFADEHTRMGNISFDDGAMECEDTVDDQSNGTARGTPIRRRGEDA